MVVCDCRFALLPFENELGRNIFQSAILGRWMIDESSLDESQLHGLAGQTLGGLSIAEASTP
jgi:hypothetical protein